MSNRLIAAAAWTVLLLGACMIPGYWLHMSESKMPFGLIQVDKVVHGVLFAGFGLLWFGVGRSRTWLATIVAVGLALAVLTEVGQGLPAIARDPDPMDALADAAGLFAALGVFLGLRSQPGAGAAERELREE